VGPALHSPGYYTGAVGHAGDDNTTSVAQGAQGAQLVGGYFNWKNANNTMEFVNTITNEVYIIELYESGSSY